jgi:hypothetical protein
MRTHPTKAGLVAGALLTTALTGLAPGLLPVAAAASGQGATRFFVPEEWDGTSHWSAEENPCGAWATTFHEVRHGGYDVLLPRGGQVAGEAHINGTVDGWIELVPDDPSLPTYTGGYREKVDGVLTDPDHDEFRVSQFRLRDRLTGTDGSHLVVLLSAKVTVAANGATVVDRSVESCS